MKNKIFKILSVVFALSFLIATVSASDCIDETDMLGSGDSLDIDESLSVDEDYDYAQESISEDINQSVICDYGSEDEYSLSGYDSYSLYFNSSKEIEGDGSSWENADNSPNGWSEVNLEGATVYLADGNYTQSSALSYSGTTFIGQGKDTIVSFFGDTRNPRKIVNYNFINLTLTKFINTEDNSTRAATLCAEYNFINCSFVDLPINVNAWSGTNAYTMLTTFENCKFSDANQTNLINHNMFCYLKFDNCTFDNITADSIIAIHTDYYVCIANSNFRNCFVKGIIYDSYGKESYVISNCSYDFAVNDTPPVHKPVYVNTTDYSGVAVIYVNNTREISGDGSSWENATNIYEVHKGLVIYLSEGNYSFSGNDCTVVGFGDKTIIHNFWENSNVTVINATFDTVKHDYAFNYVLESDQINYGISSSGKFINCTFINESFLLGYPDPLGDRFRDSIPDVSSVYFENCSFINFSANEEINEWDVNTSWGEIYHYREFDSKVLFDSYKFSIVCFNNCRFENISCECIIDSLGGQIDYNGNSDGAHIYNSTFKNCNVSGIIKARQANFCAIVNCTYDFPVSNEIPLIGPFYINSTDRPVIKTNLDVVDNGNTLIITLTDESNKPLVDYEVEIVTNGRVSYEYTDGSGKIILNNLVGNYSFEISYLGDEYAGYAPVSVNKSFSFAEISGNDTNGSNSTPATPTKVATKLTASKITATYNVAKKLVITLTDAKGKALANKKVTVKVGSISKTLKTNSKGQVSLNVATLVPKTYTATISFKEDSDYKGASLSSKVTVSKGATKLAAKAKTFKVKAKTKKFSVTLKDSKNRALKGKKLSIKVNGKTYTAKTNKKGVATFKITKLSKKGTFKSKIAFKGDKWYKAISKTVKIKVK